MTFIAHHFSMSMPLRCTLPSPTRSRLVVALLVGRRPAPAEELALRDLELLDQGRLVRHRLLEHVLVGAQQLGAGVAGRGHPQDVAARARKEHLRQAQEGGALAVEKGADDAGAKVGAPQLVVAAALVAGDGDAPAAWPEASPWRGRWPPAQHAVDVEAWPAIGAGGVSGSSLAAGRPVGVRPTSTHAHRGSAGSARIAVARSGSLESQIRTSSHEGQCVASTERLRESTRASWRLAQRAAGASTPGGRGPGGQLQRRRRHSQ
mmetsp:Transcript_17378/g.55575  ORF Transcript_17378/g.55575 Transcript_17378/m.55575 type:complete len:263 (-) Transcript_17378:266-1054(-)